MLNRWRNVIAGLLYHCSQSSITREQCGQFPFCTTTDKTLIEQN
jgi:hypothetical protein